MTDAGQKVTDALARHRASVEVAQETASALAEQREREANEAVESRMGNADSTASPNESEPQ